MARPSAMMSAALLTAAASGILPPLINRGMPALTGAPPPSSVVQVAAPLPKPGTPIPPGTSPEPVSGRPSSGGSPTNAQSPIVTQSTGGVLTLQPKHGMHVGYLVLRNASGWPNDVTIELPLLQDRTGSPLNTSAFNNCTLRLAPFEIAVRTVKVSPNPTPGQASGSCSSQDMSTPGGKSTWMELPASGLLRVRWLSTKPAGACNASAADPCKGDPDPSSLVAIVLAAPTPDSAKTMSRIFLLSLVAACLVVTFVALVLAMKPNFSLLHRMGSSTWSFQQSWGSNVTIGAGLLAGCLTLFAFPIRPRLMDQSSYSALQALFAVIVTLAPLVYGLIRRDVQANVNNLAIVDSQGYVVMFLLAGGLVLWGALGQLATVGILVWEFVLDGRLPTDIGKALEVLTILLCTLLITYGIRSLYLTATRLSADVQTATGTQPPRMVRAGLPVPAAVPSPMAEWPLL